MTEQTNSTAQILVLTTGGTIAGLSRGGNKPYQAASLSGRALQQALRTDDVSNVLRWQTVANLDSKDATPALWLDLASAVQCAQADDSVVGVVITHGTDTLEETAFALSLWLQPSKPVVITAAMRPADDEYADGPQNLTDASLWVQHLSRLGLGGLWMVMHGSVYPAARVTKQHTSRSDALQADICIARIQKGQVQVEKVEQISMRDNQLACLALPMETPADTIFPQVGIVPCYAGVTVEFFEYLVARGVAGIVIAGTGQGTFPEIFKPAIVKARAKGIVVVRSTRVPLGGVARQQGMDDDFLGTIAAGQLNPYKARVLLQCLLFSGQYGTAHMPELRQIQSAFDVY